MCNDMVLSLKSETFNVMKEDFDAVLARTIGNMQMRGAESATITLKLGISIQAENGRDWSSKVEGAMRQFQKPSFKHEINSIMQVKDKVTGALTGDMELVYDADKDEWMLRKIEDAQTSIFDDNEPVYAEAVVSDTKALTGDVTVDAEVSELKALTGDVSAEYDESEEEIINHSDAEEVDVESQSPDENVPFSDIEDNDYGYEEPDDEPAEE